MREIARVVTIVGSFRRSRQGICMKAICACASIGLLFVASRSQDASAALDVHRKTIRADGSVVVAIDGAPPQAFSPQFLVLFTERDPKLALRPGRIGKVNYNVATWFTGHDEESGALRSIDTSVTAGDGFDLSILTGDREGRTADLFHAAPSITVRANRAEVSNGRVDWHFPAHAAFELAASVELPSADAAPRLDFRLRAKRAGWFSVCYVGAPAIEPAVADDIWQPLLWQGQRFPDRSYLTQAFRCPLPAPMVTHCGATTALVVDRSELPFDPLPTKDNSRFGILVRSPAGQAQPIVCAPVLGGAGSHLQAGDEVSLRTHFVVCRGDTTDAFEHIARSLYGFADHRQNTLTSLNTTLENMIEFGLSEYSRFNEDLRGCSYATDVPGAVKNVSALHPLSAALVTDNPEIYRRRVRPMIEYLLSREKFLFATNPDVKIQSPSWRLAGPCAPVSELALLSAMTGGRNSYFMRYAIELLDQKRVLNLDEPQSARRYDSLLCLYQATGNQDYLAEAIERADGYLAHEADMRADDFNRDGLFFWTSFVPEFQELVELYEETGEQRYLRAAHSAARRFAQFVWMCPAILEGQVFVNRGGRAPVYWYAKSKQPIAVPEEQVDAWRVSEIGLTCESSGTSQGHRGVLLATHAPWMLRLAHLTGDRFLHDLGRSALVGRYANFPGYHINTARTTVYEKPDYPLRDHHELSYNSFHYNHIWPHVALVIDYLVSDVYAKSDGQIDFPSRFAEGYAYLKNKVYGDRPGRFYDDGDVWLWMPRGLLKIDNVQLNYIAGQGNGKLYIALSNQSRDDVEAKIRVNPDLVQFDSTRPRSTIRSQGQPSRSAQLASDELMIRVPAEGLTTTVMEGATARPKFQQVVADDAGVLARVPTDLVELPFADGTVGVLLSLGRDYRSAYIYLRGTYETIDKARLFYRLGEESHVVVDDDYPYEFTVELPANVAGIDFHLETVSTNGEVRRSENARLGTSELSGPSVR